MLINRLELKNFGPFEGLHSFDFSIKDPNKNIILIGGKNGTGKTTIFTAIKLALYGHLMYGYKDVHSIYLDKISKYINTKSISNPFFESYIIIDFSIEKREKINYSIKRTWKYVNSKLTENLEVYANNIRLKETEIYDFENFLHNILPPELFDFYFFNGENLSDLFLNSNYNKNIKNALLILSNLDNFEIIRKFVYSYINRNISTICLPDKKNTYKDLKEKYDTLLSKKEQIIDDIKSKANKIKDLELEKASIEKDFRKKGGLLVHERDRLIREINSLIKEKENLNNWIKNYANNLFPFVIVRDLITNIKFQLEKEEEYKNYKIISSKLNESFFKEIIENKLKNLSTSIDLKSHIDEIAITIVNDIESKIKPNFDISNFKLIHNLSADDKNNIMAIINQVEKEDRNKIENVFKKIETITKKIKKLKEKLEISDKNTNLFNFINKINDINNKINLLNQEKEILEINLSNIQENIEKIEKKLDKAYQQLKDQVKKESSLELSYKIIKTIDSFLSDITKVKIKEIESYFLQYFEKLIRKEKYIDNIEIDNDFKITLYKNKYYNTTDLLNIINNIGISMLQKYMGNKFINTLKIKLNIKKDDEIKEKLLKIDPETVFELPSKVDIENFSEGEKQIYILALYWALIKLSKYEVPFIIDTPYARIDSSHRDNITTIFFPNISKQVIILSTNEEINKEHYYKLKPYIAHEYLLKYNENENKTYIGEKYFFEVK